MLRLNNAKGQARLWLRFNNAHERPAVLLMGPRGTIRLVLMVDRDRPRVAAFPPSSRKRHEVVFTEFGKGTEEPKAWARATRAAAANKRPAFDRAALDCGFFSVDLVS
jgi:hypothetical protein